MNTDNLTFEQMPQAISYLIQEVRKMNRRLSMIEPDSGDQWLTVEELREYLPGKPSRNTIYTKTHLIPHRKNGKAIIFLKSEIDEWLKKGGWTEEPTEPLRKRKR